MSANIVPLAYGTETDTSIIGPAGISGVVGIKPTVGLTSRHGVIPTSNNLDTVGCFARTVADAAKGLSAIIGRDDNDDEMGHHAHAHAQDEDYAKYLASRGTLKGAKFGLPWTRFWDSVSPDQKALASKIFEAIEEAGAQVIRTDFPCAEERIGSDGAWNWSALGIPDIVTANGFV